MPNFGPVCGHKRLLCLLGGYKDGAPSKSLHIVLTLTASLFLGTQKRPCKEWTSHSHFLQIVMVALQKEEAQCCDTDKQVWVVYKGFKWSWQERETVEYIEKIEGRHYISSSSSDTTSSITKKSSQELKLTPRRNLIISGPFQE